MDGHGMGWDDGVADVSDPLEGPWPAEGPHALFLLPPSLSVNSLSLPFALLPRGGKAWRACMEARDGPVVEGGSHRSAEVETPPP